MCGVADASQTPDAEELAPHSVAEEAAHRNCGPHRRPSRTGHRLLLPARRDHRVATYAFLEDDRDNLETTVGTGGFRASRGLSYTQVSGRGEVAERLKTAVC